MGKCQAKCTAGLLPTVFCRLSAVPRGMRFSGTCLLSAPARGCRFNGAGCPGARERRGSPAMKSIDITGRGGISGPTTSTHAGDVSPVWPTQRGGR